MANEAASKNVAVPKNDLTPAEFYALDIDIGEDDVNFMNKEYLNPGRLETWLSKKMIEKERTAVESYELGGEVLVRHCSG